VTSGSLSDAEVADLPATIAGTLTERHALLRLLAGLPGEESRAAWLRD
jgi:hypothetical protein